MRLFGIIPAVIVVIVLIVMSAGCINNTSDKSQITTPTPAAVAVDLHMKGFNEFINGNYAAALDRYNQALAADPKYTRAWMDKGNVLVRLNRTEEAISAYDSALALENNLPIVWNSRGEALFSLGKYAEARDSFDNALKLAPEYAKAKENRNLTLAKLK